jgi:hypothetical protein
MITVKLDEATATQLAQFCKRAMIERVEPFASDEGEAYEMMKAIEELGEALKDRGFEPR